MVEEDAMGGGGSRIEGGGRIEEGVGQRRGKPGGSREDRGRWVGGMRTGG